MVMGGENDTKVFLKTGMEKEKKSPSFNLFSISDHNKDDVIILKKKNCYLNLTSSEQKHATDSTMDCFIKLK